jgi:hypothetical protein
MATFTLFFMIIAGAPEMWGWLTPILSLGTNFAVSTFLTVIRGSLDGMILFIALICALFSMAVGLDEDSW